MEPVVIGDATLYLGDCLDVLPHSRMTRKTIPIPDKFAPLFEPHRFKIFYGGRGGGKSWSIAQALVFRAAQRRQRWLCARETMSSLKESVHQLLSDQIKALGLPGFTVGEKSISNRNGSEFAFCGLKGNELGLKSYEGFDGVWVEEAVNVSKKSWDALEPTIRKPGSEIWISFNPALETDETYDRYVIHPPPDSVVVKVSWRDNPYLSEEALSLKDHMRLNKPDDFRHIWEGECGSAVKGAVYGEEMRVAESSGRITLVPYDPTKPVDTVWDLGHGDDTAIWFVQAIGGWFHFIDYEEGRGKTIEHYLIQLQRRNYIYGIAWLPHDGVNTIIHRKLAGGDASRSIEGIMRAAGWRPRIVPELYIHEGINAARTLFPLCRFDREKCRDGLHHLRMYQWGPPSKLGVQKREPLHDEHSHAADGLRGAAIAVKQPRADPPAKKPPPPMRKLFAPYG